MERTGIDTSQLGSLMALFAQTLEARGLDSQALFQRAGIDPEEMSKPNVRLPGEKVDRLWALVMHATGGDISIALDHAQRFHAGMLHVLGFGLYASETLEEASKRIARAVTIVTRATRINCVTSGGEFRVTVAPNNATRAPAREIVLHAVLLGLWRSLSRTDLVPLRVELRDVPVPRDPAVGARFDGFFGCPIQYSARMSRIVLTLSDARAPLPMANAELAKKGDAIVTAYLAELDRPDIVAAVVAKIAEGSFDKTAVARRLGLSPTALQRRMAAEHLSFTQLLNDTRKALAADYLRAGRYAVKEIAYLLGYADPANFCRAFKRWFGTTPEAFKARK